MTIPRCNPQLVTARLLRPFFPSLLRLGMARMDPVRPEIVEKTGERANQGKRLGDLSDS